MTLQQGREERDAGRQGGSLGAKAPEDLNRSDPLTDLGDFQKSLLKLHCTSPAPAET